MFMNLGWFFVRQNGMEPSWHRIGVQQRLNMEKCVPNEPTFSLSKNNNRQGCAWRSWKKKWWNIEKKQSKINQKLKPKMDGLLASVFNGFWWVLGCKLVPKIALKSISRGIKKGIPKSKHLRSDLWVSWEVSRRPWGRGGHGGRGVCVVP